MERISESEGLECCYFIIELGKVNAQVLAYLIPVVVEFNQFQQSTDLILSERGEGLRSHSQQRGSRSC